MRKDLPCAACGEPMWRGPDSLPEGKAMCQPCRRQQPGYKRGRDQARLQSYSPRQCNRCSRTYQPRRLDSRFCSAHCHNRRARSEEGTPRTCEMCSVSYFPTYNEQRACGRSCGLALKRRNAPPIERPAPSSPAGWLTCKDCQRPYTSRGRRRCGCDAPRCRVFIAECQSCASWFSSPYTISTCSDACADTKRRDDRRISKAKRRAMKRDAYRADVSPSKIYKRDCYRCKLCGKRLNMNVVVPHPKAATIDHIVPLAQGGLHEPSNTQAAHFLCNSIKGDRGGNEQLLLIG